MAALEEKETTIESLDASSWTIKETHFQPALTKIIPSVTERVWINFVCNITVLSFALFGHKTIQFFTLEFSITCLVQQLLYYQRFGESLTASRNEA